MSGSGGSWKVAYADFVTAMMAFFMVMWLVSQSQEIKEAVAEHFSNPSGSFLPSIRSGDYQPPPNQNVPPDKRRKPFRAGGNAYAEGLDAEVARVLTLHESERSSVAAVVFFEADSTEVSASARERLAEFLPKAQGLRHKIEVRGHAAAQGESGTATDPWELCFARAKAVRNVLEEMGIAPDRLRISQAGPYEAFTLKLHPEQQARNSRVEVFMLNEVADKLMGTSHERAERFAAPGN